MASDSHGYGRHDAGLHDRTRELTKLIPDLTDIGRRHPGLKPTGRLLDGFQHRYAAAYRAEMEHFKEIMTVGAQPRCTVGDARASLVLAEAVIEAARVGKSVRATLR